MGLRRGEIVTLDELMRGMAVASGNDACIAIAEHFGGVPQFVAMRPPRSLLHCFGVRQDTRCRLP